MEVDWDLNAVVRSCTASSASSTTNANAVGGAPPHLSTTTTTDASLKDWIDFSFPTTFQDPFFPITETSSAISELHEAYKPFYPKQQQGNATLNLKPALSPWSLPISPLSVINGLPDLSGEQLKLMNQTQVMVFEQLPPQGQHHLPPAVSDRPRATPRSRKKKNKLKKVCHVPMEQVKSDMWTWRKYGQKPIKGTPYPRGYYKCSTSTTCPAKKLVEKDRSTPGMFIVTYVSEHNHAMPPPRSSAAGTTRSAAAAAAAASSVADVPSPVASNPEKLDAQSIDHELIEIEDEDDDLFDISDVPIEDDFFEGLEDFTGVEFGSDDFFEGLEDLPGQGFGSDDFFEGFEDLPGQEFGSDGFFEGLEDLPGQEFGMDDFFKDL